MAKQDERRTILKYMKKTLERMMYIDQGSITYLNLHNQGGTVKI